MARNQDRPGPLPTASQSGWLRRLFGYTAAYRGSLLLGFAGALGVSGIAALTPLIIRYVVDRIVARSEVMPGLAGWLVLLSLAAVARGVFMFAQIYHGERASFGVGAALRTDMFRSLQFLDGVQQNKLETGQVVSRVTGDVVSVERAVSGIPIGAASLLQVLAATTIMMVLSPALTITAFVTVPVLLLITAHAAKTFFPSLWEQSVCRGAVANVVEEAVTGVRVVKGFGQEAQEQAKLDAVSIRLFGAGMRVVRLASRYQPILFGLVAAGQVGVMALGGLLVLRDSITLGVFVAFAVYFGTMLRPLMRVIGELVEAQTSKASALRVFEIIDYRPSVEDRAGAPAVPDGPLSIDLEGVTFGYEAGAPVLRDVDLHIRAGETFALVGTTGAGKSTIALLVGRFFDPQHGVVRVGGQDLRELASGSVRRNIGMVFDESFLFSDTIRANIAYGRPDASIEEVALAATCAQADGFIAELEHGYETVIGERGLTLSGGQRQRVAIARAYLHNPRVLVLDDATSAVDAGVEAEILASLRGVIQGRTTILIAHRKSTLRLADRIAVLHGGQVLDVGTHDELIARCGRYRTLLFGAEAAADRDGPADAEESGRVRDPWRVECFDPASNGQTAGVLPPDQQVKVGELPPLRDTPDIDPAEAGQPDHQFGLSKIWRRFRRGIVLGIGLMIVEAAARLALPALTQAGVDGGVLRHSAGVLLAMSAIALGVVLIGWAASTGQIFTAGLVGERIMYWLRTKSFAHVQRLGLEYYERERSGQLMTRMTIDIESIAGFVQGGFGQLFVACVSLIGLVVVILLISVPLTLATLTLVPVFVVVLVAYRRVSVPAYEKTRDQLGLVNSYLQENVAGIRVAQAYCRESRNIEKFRELVARHFALQARSQRYMALFITWAECGADVATVIVLAVGSGLAAAGELTAGGLIAFLLYMTMVFTPMTELSQVLDGHLHTKIGIRRIRELLDLPVTTTTPAQPVPVTKLAGRIELDNVHFGYARGSSGELADGTENLVLRGVTLCVQPGETVSIVGSTGAGKSTLLKLVARFYDPTSGSIRIDGHDLRELDPVAFRRRLGVVPQEPYLFTGSVRDTVAYGRPTAPDAVVEQATRAVCAHAMVAGLRHGYLHQVGEKGGDLSLGQRQLLALARAELPNPDILLLDEATASLDLATEAEVSRAMQALTRRRTTLLIAHRLTTARLADRIVVLEAGRIAEEGTHEELLARKGPYSRLWLAYGRDPVTSELR